MLLIISPSKTQDFSRQYQHAHTIPALLDNSQQLVENVSKMSREEIAKLMKVSNKLADSTWQSFHEFQVPFNTENAKQALFAFKGDVYSGIRVEEYSKEQLDFAQKHLRILSGLYGVLRPLDLIQAYRLEMGTKLTTDRGDNLYKFWGEKPTSEINRALEESESPVLVNLASLEYFKVIKAKMIKGKIVNISFKEEKNGKYRTIAIFAKRARGKMVDFVVENRLTELDELRAFKEDSYQFNEDLSSPEELVFCRG